MRLTENVAYITKTEHDAIKHAIVAFSAMPWVMLESWNKNNLVEGEEKPDYKAIISCVKANRYQIVE